MALLNVGGEEIEADRKHVECCIAFLNAVDEFYKAHRARHAFTIHATLSTLARIYYDRYAAVNVTMHAAGHA